MPNICELTGKSVLRANRVSHANNRRKFFLQPNIQNKKYYVPELKRSVTLRLTAQAIKTITKRGGLARAILDERLENLSPRLLALRKTLTKPKRPKAKPAKAS
jgi:large subunit ribosomal protein L28